MLPLQPLNWWSLRAVGNLYILKVSYFVLLVTPFLSKHDHILLALGLPGLLTALLFFGSFALAIANLVYDIWCPVIVKRFASPNDLYETMLRIRSLSISLYPNDNFDATLQHCKLAYTSHSTSKWFARIICTVLFIFSGGAFLVIFVYRGWIVLKAAL